MICHHIWSMQSWKCCCLLWLSSVMSWLLASFGRSTNQNPFSTRSASYDVACVSPFHATISRWRILKIDELWMFVYPHLHGMIRFEESRDRDHQARTKHTKLPAQDMSACPPKFEPRSPSWANSQLASPARGSAVKHLKTWRETKRLSVTM